MSKPILFLAPDEMAAALAKQKETTGVPVSEFIRRTLQTRLEQENPKSAETK